MKAKITWTVFLLTVLSLTGASKNVCGKKTQHYFAGAQAVEPMTPPIAHDMGTEEECEAPGISPVKLFLFQLK